MTAAIDAKSFWRCLGERAIGATVVTVDGEAGPAGFLALSASHVSADPPTMLVSIDKRTGAYADILARRRFAINILPAEATGLADAFGGKTAAKGADRFEPGAWTTLSTGAPVLASALGVFDCEVEEVIDRGGVALVIGRVLALASKGEGAPLVAFRGQYRS